MVEKRELRAVMAPGETRDIRVENQISFETSRANVRGSIVGGWKVSGKFEMENSKWKFEPPWSFLFI